MQPWQPLLDFWFGDDSGDAPRAARQAPLWWGKSSETDALLTHRFGELAQGAAEGELAHWAEVPVGRLALILLLDQLPRNIHRGTPAAFAQDAMALVLSQEATRTPEFAEMTQQENNFLLMPMMHSESTVIHQAAECLFRKYGSDESYQFELKHKAIIDAFGRYPHRNAVLGRASTEAERAFLSQPGSSF